MRRTLGSLLSGPDKAKVLDSYLYRMTFESVKRWPDAAKQMYATGYRLTLISDEQWLSSTTFVVRKDGRIPDRHFHCNHDVMKFRTIKE